MHSPSKYPIFEYTGPRDTAVCLDQYVGKQRGKVQGLKFIAGKAKKSHCKLEKIDPIVSFLFHNLSFRLPTF